MIIKNHYPNCMFRNGSNGCFDCIACSICEQCKSKGLSDDEHYEELRNNECTKDVSYYDQLKWKLTRNVMNMCIMK